MNLNEIVSQFDTEFEAVPYGDGHINDTYLSKDGKKVLQRINTDVFKNPKCVMDNMVAVTSHLKKKIAENGGNPDRETISLIQTKDGKYYTEHESGVYRMYNFIDGATAYNFAQTGEQMYHSAKAIGKFFSMLSDFDASNLGETIAGFHNTPKRYEAFEEALENNISNRADTAEDEINFVKIRKDICSVVTDGISDGSIPMRVTHNDTKLNNVLLDDITGEGICVIDLDTVMPGSILYDFGDALRFGASTGAEDEKDLDKIWFDKDKFRSFAKGFLEEVGPVLTEREKELLVFSVKLMCYECGMRFLTDYINGDTYFKTSYDNHNLVRAKTQFKLISDIENNEEELENIIKGLLK